MQIYRVKGSVVSTDKSDRLYGMKLLLVKAIDMDTFAETGSPLVAADAVGVGEGEVVMCTSGSPSRLTAMTDAKPVDLLIVAVVDSINTYGSRIFDKSKPEKRKEDADSKS